MHPAKPSILNQVRATLIQQGTSFTKWCEDNHLSRQWATAALSGKSNGPAAIELRTRIVKQLKLKAAA